MGTLKKAIAEMMNSEGLHWFFIVSKALYGYKKRCGRAEVSHFQLMFGHPPSSNAIEASSHATHRTEESGLWETMVHSKIRVSRALRTLTHITSE